MIDTQVARPVSGGYPRVYRAKAKYRVLTSVLMVVIGVPAVAGIFYFGTGHLAKNPRAAVQLAVMCAMVALGSGYAAGWSRVGSVTLWGDRIEIRGLFRSRALLRDDIVGFITDYSANDSGRIEFVSRNQRRASISRAYDFDQEFEEWTSSLTDLLAEERRASEEIVKNNEQLGRRRLDRVHALRRAKRLEGWIAIGSIVIFMWGSFVRVPYMLSVIVLVLLPWLAVATVARSHGLYTFAQDRGDVRPNMLFPYILPGIALTTRVLLEVKLIDWRVPLYLTLGVASVLAAAALMAGRPMKYPRVMALALFVIALPYGFGASIQANFQLDRSEPQQFRARVVSKEKHRSRSSSEYVQLAPWGPLDRFDRVGVHGGIYKSVAVGDDLCVSLHDGALRVPWYTVGLCGKDQKRAAE